MIQREHFQPPTLLCHAGRFPMQWQYALNPGSNRNRVVKKGGGGGGVAVVADRWPGYPCYTVGGVKILLELAILLDMVIGKVGLRSQLLIQNGMME